MASPQDGERPAGLPFRWPQLCSASLVVVNPLYCECRLDGPDLRTPNLLREGNNNLPVTFQGSFIVSQSLSFQKAANQSTPPGCQAVMVRYVAALDIGPADVLDLRQQILTGYINAIQAVFIDNRQNGSPVTVLSDSAIQALEIPANSQAWLPILVVPGAETFSFFSSGGVVVPFIFVNVAMPASVWKSI